MQLLDLFLVSAQLRLDLRRASLLKLLQLFKFLLMDELQVTMLVLKQHQVTLDLVNRSGRLELELLKLLLEELALLVKLLLVFVQTGLILVSQALLLVTHLLLVIMPLMRHLLDVLLERDFELG